VATSKQCPKCGASLFWAEDIGSYCTSCGWKEPPKQSSAAPQYRSTGYVPGTFSHGDTGSAYTSASEAPSGFNWGAFLIPFWWCAGMRLWGWAVALVLVPLIGTIAGIVVAIMGAVALSRGGVMFGLAILAVTGPLFAIVTGIYLGSQGNELAWHSRPFDSVDQFMAVQRAWTAVGIVVFLAAVVLNFVEFKMLQAKVEEASQELQMPLR